MHWNCCPSTVVTCIPTTSRSTTSRHAGSSTPGRKRAVILPGFSAFVTTTELWEHGANPHRRREAGFNARGRKRASCSPCLCWQPLVSIPNALHAACQREPVATLRNRPRPRLQRRALRRHGAAMAPPWRRPGYGRAMAAWRGAKRIWTRSHGVRGVMAKVAMHVCAYAPYVLPWPTKWAIFT